MFDRVCCYGATKALVERQMGADRPQGRLPPGQRGHLARRSPRGGAEGVSQFSEHDSEDAALEIVRVMLNGPGNWRELSTSG